MNKYIAEALGTFFLVFCGTGAIMIDEISKGALTHPGVALCFGLIVMGMIYAIGDISGAHINPAVTVGFWASGRLPVTEVLPYLISQFAGALTASGALLILLGDHAALGATLPKAGIAASFTFEFILTFLLMFVIITVSTGAKEKGMMAGIAVGGMVALAALLAGPVCGASMNPARSLAPALFSSHLEGLWIYMTAPFLGALTGVFSCKWVKGNACCQKQIPESSV